MMREVSNDDAVHESHFSSSRPPASSNNDSGIILVRSLSLFSCRNHRTRKTVMPLASFFLIVRLARDAQQVHFLADSRKKKNVCQNQSVGNRVAKILVFDFLTCARTSDPCTQTVRDFMREISTSFAALFMSQVAES